MIKPVTIKSAFSFILIFLLLSVVVSGVNAAGKNTVSSIKIFVDLDESGNGRVEEIWDMEVYEGTENYKQFFGLKFGESISDFSVRENFIDYEFVEKWDVNKLREEKANKCGIHNTNEGPELCWGMGRDNGRHIYTIQYTINKLAVLATDPDGEKKAALYWQFITKTFQYAEKVQLTIKTPQPITDDYYFWIFGFNGEIIIEGNEYIITADQVRVGHFVELALVMPAKDFPGASETGPSRLTAIYQYGKSGNELGRYTSKAPKEKSSWPFFSVFFVLFFIVFFGIFAAVIAVFVKGKSRTDKISKYAPSGKMPEENVEALTCFLSALNYYPDLLRTFMMKWISKKYLEMKNIIKRSFLNINAEQVIKLNSAPETFDGDVERMLFELVVKAFQEARSDTLSVDEFQRYVKSREKYKIFNHHKNTCMDYCYQRGWVNDPHAKKGDEKILTADGQKLYHEILGFGSFLYNRSFLEQNEEEYLPLLDYFLVFAELLGISGKFQLDFSKSFPSLYETDSMFDFMRSRFYYDPSSSSDSSGDSGGSGSSGGGGGGSSGGGGGGTR